MESYKSDEQYNCKVDVIKTIILEIQALEVKEIKIKI